MGDRKLVCVGAGGFAREISTWIEDIDMYYVDVETKDNFLGEIIIIRDTSYLRESDVIISIADPKARIQMASKLHYLKGIANATPKMHKSVHYGRGVYAGMASIICQNVVLTTNILIGIHTHINLNCTVGHDCQIGAYCTISPGVNISGNVTIGDGVFIGTGACIREGVRIGAGATIGMGAVVLKDVPPGETWVGNPARKLR